MSRRFDRKCGPGFTSDGLGGCFDCHVCDERPNILECNNCQKETTQNEPLTSDLTMKQSGHTTDANPVSQSTSNMIDVGNNHSIVIIVTVSFGVLFVILSLLYLYQKCISGKQKYDLAETVGDDNTEVKLPITTCVTSSPLLKNKTEDERTFAVGEESHAVLEILTVNLPEEHRDEQPVCQPQDRSSHGNTDCAVDGYVSLPYSEPSGVLVHPAAPATNEDSGKTQTIVQ